MSDPQQPLAPPPHPYAAAPHGSGGQRGGGVSIAAMAVGLAAFVTAIIAALYFGLGAILAGLLGVAAVVLGIVGLVSRRRRLHAVIGLASGALAVLVSLALGIAAVVMLAAGVGSESGAGSAIERPGSNAEIEWPENMATGGVIFDRDGVVTSDAPASGQPEAETPSAQAHSVRVYVDYRCPYCSVFETTNGETLTKLASSGAATVEVVPLAFLDRISPDAYSSRASAAFACVADAQPEAAWDVHQHLFDPAVQPSETEPGLDNDALIAAVDAAADGASDEVRDCIASEKFVPFAQALNTWVFDSPVPGAKDPDLAVTGTPFVVVDGEPYAGALDDPRAFTDFLAAQGVASGSAT